MNTADLLPYANKFLSFYAQDFIEVSNKTVTNTSKEIFLSFYAQDFIEVFVEWFSRKMVGIPKLLRLGLH